MNIIYINVIFMQISLSWEEYNDAQCRTYTIPEILPPDWKCKIISSGSLIICILNLLLSVSTELRILK